MKVIDNTIYANSLEEFDALINQRQKINVDVDEGLNQYRVLFLNNNRVLVSYSDNYNRFYDDMNILVSNIKAYQNFDVSFEDEISSIHMTVNDLLKSDTPLETQCILNENTNLADFLNHWGKYPKIKEFIDCFNQYNKVEKQLLELPIEKIITENPIQEDIQNYSPMENNSPKSIKCPLKDYISFQIYCNYIYGSINDKEYTLILSNQDEIYNMMLSHNNLDYAIYYTLVKNTPYIINNPYIKDKLLVLDNPILKVYNGTWHLYDESTTYENIQAYRVNCIDITGRITIHDISSKNYSALKDKTNNLNGLYALCKNINEGTDTESTTTIMFSNMFSNQPAGKEDRIVFCQKISKMQNSLTWKLIEVTMAGTLSECINYMKYKFEPIVLNNSFIKEYIQKDNIIDSALIPKMTTYPFEFFILRPNKDNHHITIYNAPITIPLTKDIKHNLSILINNFQSNSDRTIQPNDLIIIKKKSTSEAVAYKYISDTSYEKVNVSNIK